MIYLCGPINGCSDLECVDWREHVKTWGYPTLDPMRRDYRGRELECVDEIVEGDKEDIENCSVILVNYIKPSVGTSMEIFFAHSLGIPVVVVAESGQNLSPWLIYHASKIVGSFAEARTVVEALGFEG